MIQRLFLMLCLITNTVYGGDIIHVKSGKTLTLNPEQSVLELDTLILEDNSMLVVPAGTVSLQLSASEVQIGRGVKIQAQGMPGKDGAPGTGYSTPAQDCESGKDGGTGASGEPGQRGVDLSLRFNFIKLGSLVIDTSGGAGGNGGDGGNGQNAGEFDYCTAPEGGDGGAGGNGADGGDGGQVRLFYTTASDLDQASIRKSITIISKGGEAGAAGKAGLAGAGSEGKYITKRTLGGNRKWEAGGDAGKPGVPGTSGNDGVNASVVLEQALDSGRAPKFGSASIQQATTNSGDEDRLLQRVERQEEQLQRLQQRIQQLEITVQKLTKP